MVLLSGSKKRSCNEEQRTRSWFKHGGEHFQEHLVSPKTFEIWENYSDQTAEGHQQKGVFCMGISPKMP